MAQTEAQESVGSRRGMTLSASRWLTYRVRAVYCYPSYGAAPRHRADRATGTHGVGPVRDQQFLHPARELELRAGPPDDADARRRSGDVPWAAAPGSWDDELHARRVARAQRRRSSPEDGAG